jgi:hypothetical protein
MEVLLALLHRHAFVVASTLRQRPVLLSSFLWYCSSSPVGTW